MFDKNPHTRKKSKVEIEMTTYTVPIENQKYQEHHRLFYKEKPWYEQVSKTMDTSAVYNIYKFLCSLQDMASSSYPYNEKHPVLNNLHAIPPYLLSLVIKQLNFNDEEMENICSYAAAFHYPHYLMSAPNNLNWERRGFYFYKEKSTDNVKVWLVHGDDQIEEIDLQIALNAWLTHNHQTDLAAALANLKFPETDSVKTRDSLNFRELIMLNSKLHCPCKDAFNTYISREPPQNIQTMMSELGLYNPHNPLMVDSSDTESGAHSLSTCCQADNAIISEMKYLPAFLIPKHEEFNRENGKGYYLKQINDIEGYNINVKLQRSEITDYKGKKEVFFVRDGVDWCIYADLANKCIVNQQISKDSLLYQQLNNRKLLQDEILQAAALYFTHIDVFVVREQHNVDTINLTDIVKDKPHFLAEIKALNFPEYSVTEITLSPELLDLIISNCDCCLECSGDELLELLEGSIGAMSITDEDEESFTTKP